MRILMWIMLIGLKMKMLNELEPTIIFWRKDPLEIIFLPTELPYILHCPVKNIVTTILTTYHLLLLETWTLAMEYVTI